MDIYESESDFAETKVKQLKHQIIDTGKNISRFIVIGSLAQDIPQPRTKDLFSTLFPNSEQRSLG